MLYEFVWSIIGIWFFHYYAIWCQRDRIRQKYNIFINTDKTNELKERFFAGSFLICVIVVAIYGLFYCYRFIVAVNDIIHYVF